MIKVYINGKVLFVPYNTTVFEACKFIGLSIPRFCFHKKLLIAGNCRMCVVELENSPKPAVSCFLPVVNNLRIFTDTPLVKKAREGVLEFLLMNHPLDCPICDQAGECDLQDQTIAFGNSKNRFFSLKRSVEDKDCGPLIKTIMNRCIHCTRCVRFFQDCVQLGDLGTLNRGNSTEIGTYLRNLFFKSEFSSCIVDLCPVGALTSKPYSFIARPWELKSTDTIDLSDGVGASIRVDSKETEVVRILPSKNEKVKEDWISDKARFCFDSLKIQRIDRPYFNRVAGNQPKAWSWKAAVKEARFLLRLVGPFRTSVVFSPNLGLNAIKEIQQFSNTMGIRNVGFPRRLHVNCDFMSSFAFNTSLNDLMFSDLCLLLGTNPRFEAALLNLKIKKRQQINLGCFTLGLAHNLTYKTKVLGVSSSVLLAGAEGKHFLCKYLKKAKKPILIYGSGLMERKDAFGMACLVKTLSKYAHIRTTTHNGCCFLNQESNQVGALLLGASPVRLPSLKKCQVCLVIGPVAEEDLSLLDEFIHPRSIIYIGSNIGCSSMSELLMSLPMPNSFEQSDFFVNIEGVVQKALKCVPVSFTSKQLTDILSVLKGMRRGSSFSATGHQNRGGAYFFPTMKIAEPALFNEAFSSFESLKRFVISKQLFYPFMTDFFCSGALSEFSRTLARSSSYYRAAFTNFLDKL